jgi:hypothetical protein
MSMDDNRKIEDKRRDDARTGRNDNGYPPCGYCGNRALQLIGRCFTCTTCGETTGCG